MSPQDTAHQKIDQFHARWGPGVWTYLHRWRLVEEMHARVDDPTKVRQGQCGLCGPAAFLEDLITDDPVLYAQMGADLFDLGFTHMVRGHGNHGGRFLKPDKDLRTNPIPFDKNGVDYYIPEADWMLLSSIRQSCDFWFWEHFYKAKPDEGGTWPDQVTDFFKDVGYSKVINHTGKSDQHSQVSAEIASRFVEAGYHVVMLINANLLVPRAAYEDNKKDTSNHWVGLVSPITGGPLKVEFKIFTWGETLSIPLRIKDRHEPPLDIWGNMTWDTLLDYYYGYIAAKY
jgi:hypothetical protein